MNARIPLGWNMISVMLGGMLLLFSCAREPTPPPVDMVGTLSMQLAAEMQTQTVAAYSPTSLPATSTLIPTETLMLEPTKDTSSPIIEVVGQSPCYFGPGPSYNLESYISDTKKVKLLGVGSVEGWYVIMNPYFNQPCWIAAANVKIPSYMDVSLYPVITP